MLLINQRCWDFLKEDLQLMNLLLQMVVKVELELHYGLWVIKRFFKDDFQSYLNKEKKGKFWVKYGSKLTPNTAIYCLHPPNNCKFGASPTNCRCPWRPNRSVPPLLYIHLYCWLKKRGSFRGDKLTALRVYLYLIWLWDEIDWPIRRGRSQERSLGLE